MEAAAWDLLTTTYSLVNREPVSGLTEPVLLKLQGAGRGRGQAGNWHLLWKEEGKKKNKKIKQLGAEHKHTRHLCAG